MNNKGEITITSVVVSLLVVGALAFVFGAMITNSSNSYDISGYDNDTLQRYNQGESLASDITEINGQVDNLVVDANVFDYFAGIWNKISSPFKTIYQSFETANTLTRNASDDLGIMPEFKVFLVSAITIIIMLIVIGIYIGRKT